MKLSWPDDAGEWEIGGRPDGRLAGQAAGRPRLPLGAGAAPVGGPAAHAAATAWARRFPGEHAGTGQRRSLLHYGDPAEIRSCWMCGIHLPGDQIVADGGSACPDLRWYCQDTWACTQRWTSRPARAASRQGTAEPPKTPGKQVTGADVAPPVPV